ncbi:MAG: peptidase U32 family protein [Promethearchaeota archaeon]
MEYNKKIRPELIAPAQDWSSLKIVSGLVDAIYFGVQKYNMRAKAKNFKRKDLRNIVEFCRNQNPKIRTYLCSNILIYDSELQDLEILIVEAQEAGIDAIIAHDLAAIRIAKRHNMNFHISTQANVSNIEAAKFYEGLGARRIVLARELSLNQIAKIKSQLNETKVECFVHGSMCTSISGRCYFSATICESEEFSANRGNCVQPCRREWRLIDDENHEFIYDGQLFLNAKDLCMIEHIPALVEAGIDAFKIEGRMKDPLYIKTVTECYKEALESYFNNSYTNNKVRKWLGRLSKVYNRGFHTGFYFNKPTIEDIELQKRGNISPYKKQYLGKIISFDKKNLAADMIIENKNLLLNIGDEIIIIGNNSSFIIDKIKKMFLKGKRIKSAVRTENYKPVKINICLNHAHEPNDKIYIISKK